MRLLRFARNDVKEQYRLLTQISADMKKTQSRLDPRTRIALGLMGIFAVLITQKPMTTLVEFCILLVSLPFLKLTGAWARSLRLLIPLVGLVFVIALLAFDIQVAYLLSLRLLNLLTLSFIFFQNLEPEELGDSMRKVGLPYEFSFILTTSMRYVPLIGKRIRRIIDAQRSRGIDLRPRLKNLPHFMALLMPLLVQSFILSEELAMAMESRGFARKGRTIRKDYHITPGQYGIMIISLGLLVSFTWWERG